MSNSFAVTDKCVAEALMVLENNCVMGNMVNRQYSDEFKTSDDSPLGLTVRVKKPPRFTVRSGAVASAQDVTESTVNVGPIAQYGVDLTVTSLETLSSDLAWKNFSEKKLKPALATLANKIDYDLCTLYNLVPNWVGTAGTTPSTSAVILDAGVKLSEMGAPFDERYTVVNAKANGALVDGLKGLFHANANISRQFTKGMMGANTLGFDEIALDQNINTHIGGLQAGTALINGATQTGTSLITDGWTASTTITKGTVFTCPGVYAVNPQNRASTGSLQQFVVTAAVTADGSGNATLSIYPAITTSGAFQTVTASPTNNDAITLLTRSSTTIAGGDPQNLAFHKNAFALAMVDLPLPGGVHYAARKTYKDYAIRVISFYDGVNDKMYLRFDVAYAVACLYGELACRISG